MDLCLLLKKMHRNICQNMSKNLSSKYSEKLIDYAKQSATDCFKKSNSENSRRNWQFNWE